MKYQVNDVIRTSAQSDMYANCLLIVRSLHGNRLQGWVINGNGFSFFPQYESDEGSTSVPFHLIAEIVGHIEGEVLLTDVRKNKKFSWKGEN